MARVDDEPLYAGDPTHPEHEQWLQALGQATLGAARLSGIAFDVLRVLGGHPSEDLYSDPLGTLEGRLRALAKRRPDLPEVVDFLAELGPARELRNDLLHALPVRHGLHRRETNDPSYVRDFFTVESLLDATRVLNDAAGRGSVALYRDGGSAVQAWYAAQQS